MASSSSHPPPDATDESYRKMSVGDVEAIGAHCQMPFCHQLDFLPFRCESCKGNFCLDHRTETSHKCPNEGAWAAKRAQANRANNTSSSSLTPSKPNILSHEQQCAHPTCKTLINTPLVTGVHCEKCNYSYCLKHRFTYEHDCANLKPKGARPGGGGQTQRERGLAALEKLRAWGAAKKVSSTSTTTSSTTSTLASAFFPSSTTKTSKPHTSTLASLSTLKRTAKGDPKTPLDKRIYLHVEASSSILTAKIPKGNFFYSSEYNVGRVLDLAAKSLQVQNVNNRSESEEEKLRVFHVEGGRLLDFGERVGACVKSGDTIVLLRGVGGDLPVTPEKMG